jgi:hypothetical protein
MTDDEWLRGLVTFEDVLREWPEYLSERKRRLFICSCLRLAWPVLADVSRQAVEAAELFADGRISWRERDQAWNRCLELRFLGADSLADRAALLAVAGDREIHQADGIIRACAQIREALLYEGGRKVASGLLDDADQATIVRGTYKSQNVLFRDMFGGLGREHLMDPEWLQWEAGVLEELAGGIYDECRWLEMTVLGDALEDAGCTHDDMIDHCHQGGPHTRGCWVLDIILGKQ